MDRPDLERAVYCGVGPIELAPRGVLAHGSLHERQVRSVVNLHTGESVSAEAHQAKSIEELFALVEGALAQGAYRVAVSYDWILGYPTSIFIDDDRQAVDDEISYYARELRAVQ